MRRRWLFALLWLVFCGCDNGAGSAASNSSATSTDTSMEDGAAHATSDASASHDATSTGADSPSNDATEEMLPLGYLPCPLDQHIGGFEISLATDYTGVSGQVLDGVVPGNVPEVVATDEGCELLQKKSLFCDPGCVPGETCDTDGTCIPYPEAHSVGLVTVDGLKSPLVMEAKWGNHYTNPGSLEHPGYEAGADIRLSAEGGDFEPFQLRGLGVSALEAITQTVHVTDADDLTLSWAAPSEAGPAKIHIELNINNHGSTSAWIACEADDTGSFIIAGTLLGELAAIGVSGFPSLTLYRRSVDSVTLTPGCVQFAVVSEAALSIQVEGVTSCTHDGQCPQGQSCGVDLQCH